MTEVYDGMKSRHFDHSRIDKMVKNPIEVTIYTVLLQLNGYYMGSLNP